MPSFELPAILAGNTSQLCDALTCLSAATNQRPEDLRQQLAARVYRQLIARPQLDMQLLPLFTRMEPHWVQGIALDDHFYSQPSHPLRQLFDRLLPAASHWYAREGKQAQQFYDKISALLAALTAAPPDNVAGSQAPIIEEFFGWLGTEEKRAALLESRLCETELSSHKLASAQARVINLLNKYLAQRPLPLELHTAIATNLKSELQYWASNTPAAELDTLPLWLHWQRMLPLLGQVFALDAIKVDDQQLYSQIPALLTELERSLSQPTSNHPAYQQLVDNCSHSLMLAIQKHPQEIALFPPLPPPQGQALANTQLPQALVQATDAIQPGDWIIMRGDQQEGIRCKLALKDASIDQLLFVDHAGRKVMSKTAKEFALCLSTALAQPLVRPPLALIIEQQLTPLIEQANQAVTAKLLQQKQKAEALVRAFMAEQQALMDAAERERQAEQARLQAELQARKAAAHKAMEEARALAAEQTRRAAEQAAERERQIREQAAKAAAEQQQRAQAAIAAVNHLQVGAWLEFNSSTQPPGLRAKLAVIIGATGKYIFADQVGRKLAELTREQLIQQLTSGELTLLRNGDNFEEQLAKVIRGLRRDVN